LTETDILFIIVFKININIVIGQN